MGKKALITGVTGQDGSYLAELLLSKGYEVHGIIRRASTFNTSRLEHLYADPHIPAAMLKLHYGDLSDASALARLIGSIAPDEIAKQFMAANAHLTADSMAVTCATGELIDVRFCLTKDLRAFYRCPKVAAHTCHAQSVSISPVR